MNTLEKSEWLLWSLAATAATSAMVLSVQRRWKHTNHPGTESESVPDQDFLSPHQDKHRDLSVPYADDYRLPRLTVYTTILTCLSAYRLYGLVLSSAPDAPETMSAIVNAACSVASWLYISLLVLISRQHTLPNAWGWILNIHLCLLSLMAWVLSAYDVVVLFVGSDSTTLPWLQVLPVLINALLTTDMVYVTITVEQGPPFLDNQNHPVSRLSVTSIWGFINFNWFSPVIKMTAEKGTITTKDLPTMVPSFRSAYLYHLFGSTRGQSLLYRIYRANKMSIYIQVFMAVLSSTLYYGPIYLTNVLLNMIQEYTQGTRDKDIMTKGVLIVIGLGIMIIILGLVVAQLWYWASVVMLLRIRTMLNLEIYHKTLRRADISSNNSSTKDTDDTKDTKDTKKKEDEDEEEDVSSSTGTIVNLMSTDSNRISEFSAWWFSVFSAPSELAIGVFFLYQLLGKSCFLGLLVLVFTLPLNHFNAKMFAKTQDRLMDVRDKRVGLMNEVLQGIRQIKFFAWESKWEERVMESRKEEIKHLRTVYILEVLFGLLWQGSPILVTIISFWSFTKLEGNELTAPIAFTAVSIFNELRFALNVLPETFIESLQALTSVCRIQKYLDEPEISQPAPLNLNVPVEIGFQDATITWKSTASSSSSSVDTTVSDTTASSDDSRFLLKDLSFQFPDTKLSLICGTTGSGKTLLMLSLLGEAAVVQGQVKCPRIPVADTVTNHFTPNASLSDEEWILSHTIAYVSQTAWLQNASIRDNILFGLPMVEKRYKATLTACALDKDFTILEDGDFTEIGEKGITLSGGQKARVALARAVYSRAKTILMDDVLSAVDAHTAKHLYKKCLMGPLMQSRTRILVTHHVHLCLEGSDYLVHIQDGRVNVLGHPTELRQSGLLASIMEEEKDIIKSELNEESIEDIQEESAAAAATEAALDSVMQKKPKVLVEDEKRATGMVKLRLYTLYISTVGGYVFWAFLLLLIFSSRGSEVLESWWIKQWTQSYDNPTPQFILMINMSNVPREAPINTNLPFSLSYLMSTFFSFQPATASFTTTASKADSQDNLNFYLGIYIIITMSNIVLNASKSFVLYLGALKASRSLYLMLLRRVLRAPLRFFDTTPIGRILNRFSKDFETIDSSIPNDMMHFTVQTLMVTSSVVVVSSVMPTFLIPVILVTMANISLGSMFVMVARELKRIDSTNRSPLFSHFTETIVGVVTIRAFGVTQQFLQDMVRLMDNSVRPSFHTWIANRWVSVRFAALSAVINMVAGFIVLISLDRMDAALAGFCFSFILMYSNQIFWMIRRYTSMEMNFNSVERVVEFMEMEQEAPSITNVRPPANWPTRGEIEVRHLEVRYAADLDPVLKDLSFKVNPSEKIGVVGRTGSGKSTLALSFFRFIEASKGSIIIDNIDIRHIGTEDLRSNLTIIPQDPTLFSGSIRSNMDPFDQFTDEDIFAALRRVQLLPLDDATSDSEETAVNANVFRNLTTSVNEGGKNFSQGQRQLLCLARALLKRSRIVLMDEATASVDFQTDKAIQKTISTEFAECMILCIAHRLHTVIEYDRILVLDQGTIVEFENPLQLINNTESTFYKMCRNSGEFDSLVALARSKHQLVDVDN
ncbi:P-loop containing nucleoside triphosphate hydrolase protein [Spinellus fusiger]|nr:P-loop containing nucleoside triphosphate hydrolase protein [Spinellus fusiger]